VTLERAYEIAGATPPVKKDDKKAARNKTKTKKK